MPSVVVGRWLGAGARGRGGGRGVGGGGRTGINRIVSIHPSGSSRDLDAPISSLHCLACRITRPRPLCPAHRRSVPFPRLEKCSFTLFVVLVYLFFFSRSLPSLSSFRKTKKNSVREYSLAAHFSHVISIDIRFVQQKLYKR